LRHENALDGPLVGWARATGEADIRPENVETAERKPIIAVTAVGVAAVAAVVQYAVPSAVPVLERESGALEAGEWWRLVTPLFVQTLGWYQVVTNLATLAVVGVVAERLFGRWRWAVLFAAGAIGGQIAAYAWWEPGGGDSIAICGLAGGTVIWLLAGQRDASRWAVGAVVCYIAALTGWGFGGIRAAAVAALAAVVVLRVVRVRGVALVGAVACAVALTVVADLHGVSLLSGMTIALVITCCGVGSAPRSNAPAGFAPVTDR
jgi:membrane associated rhomboid family serine protease